MNLRALTLGVVAGALILPVSAQAATITAEGDALVFRAAPGERNSVHLDRSWNPDGRLRFEDWNGISAFPDSCTARQDTMVDCDVPGGVRVEVADGDDAVGFGEDYAFAIPVEVLGGDGADKLHGNHEEGVAERLDGGAGNDSVDGFGGDDEVLGGPGDDRVEGNGGNDRVLGGDGNDELAGDDQAAPGADVVDGGGGVDHVKDYVEYGTDIHPPANVSLDGVADDGRPGEGDNVVGVERFTAYVSGRFVLTDGAEEWDVWSNMNSGASEVLAGGGNDKVTGQDAIETIDGGPGDDVLTGGKNHDTITGGPGADLIYGDETTSSCRPEYPESCVRYGNDTIDARDGERDQIDCGAGTDRVRADALDVVAPTCESVEVGGASSATGAGGAGGAGGMPTGAAGEPAEARRAVTATGTTKLRAVLRRGLRLRLRTGKPGRARIVARDGRRVVASARVRVARNGTATATLRFTGAARRTLARRRSVRLTITGAGVRGTVTLRR